MVYVWQTLITTRAHYRGSQVAQTQRPRSHYMYAANDTIYAMPCREASNQVQNHSAALSAKRSMQPKSGVCGAGAAKPKRAFCKRISFHNNELRHHHRCTMKPPALPFHTHYHCRCSQTIAAVMLAWRLLLWRLKAARGSETQMRAGGRVDVALAGDANVCLCEVSGYRCAMGDLGRRTRPGL